MKLFIVHPGIQHSPRLANGALRSGLFEKVTLMTSILFKPKQKVLGLLKKRIKPIDENVKVINHYLYTFLYTLTSRFYNFAFRNPNDQSHNNPIYFWQQVFGWMSLPVLWLNRKNCMVIVFETAGCPVAKYCKQWNIPVVMDFASISHEKAKELGINETKYGIALKEKERQFIDYAIYCSEFCKESFKGKTSSKKDMVLYLGAEENESTNHMGLELLSTEKIRHLNAPIKISFIANLEYRKGLDFLLDALLIGFLGFKVEVHLIGRLSKDWVSNYLNGRELPDGVSIVYKSAMPQQALFTYLRSQQFDLNIQPSRFDSFAMVVPETMMLGIPNILSPCVGAGEMLDHLKNGYRMKELSAEAIVMAINLYASIDSVQQIKLRENVLLKSKEMSWDNYYHETSKVFSQLLFSKKQIKIAFIVEFPTQFEVPFYQFIAHHLHALKGETISWYFDVIFTNVNEDYADRELKQKINWGFDLFENYSFFNAKKGESLESIKQILVENSYDFAIINGYKNSYEGLPKLCKSLGIPIALRIDSVKYNLSPIKKALKFIYMPFAYRHFNHFFAVGSETKLFLNWLGISNPKINYFSYATHDTWFKEKANDKENIEKLRNTLGLSQEQVILSVAKFIERESPWDVMHAFIQLNDTNIVLILVGDGRESFALEALAKKHAHLKIVFTGYVPYLNLPLYYGLADIFVHSAKNEPWGVSVQEAIASGCTVITSDKVGSSTDLVKEGLNGFVYPYQDINKLSNLMKQSFKLDANKKEAINQEVLKNWGYEFMWNEIKVGALICAKKDFY
ncbi:MAG: glycosyltransferase [Oligoflexus sp.]|nr:glycosyltransferase [Pseudopedobacter sp.]